jgi:hypothetical protein
VNNLSRLGDFTMLDQRRSILFLVWQAREMLSAAEHDEAATVFMRAHRCGDAAMLLDSASVLISQVNRDDPTVIRALDTTNRAVAAARAAHENGKLADLYQQASQSPTGTEWDRQRSPKATGIFKRAAETARNETHRALAELCEVFPNAMPEED